MAQSNDNEDIKWLYGKLKAKGYDIGSEDDFTSSLANSEDRKWYYDKAKGMGLDMGSMEDFESLYAPKAAKAEDLPVQGNEPEYTVQADTEPEQEPVKELEPKGTPLTEEDKLRMSRQMGQMMQQAQQGAADTDARIGRMMEPATAEGREKRNMGRLQAQMSGAPTRVVGFSAAATDENGDVTGDGQQTPVRDTQSPQPYGVVYENGKAKTQWLLPDGTLTTSLTEASHAEYGAMNARLEQKLHERMKANGLDPENPEDVQTDYLLGEKKRIESELDRRGKELDAEADKEENSGFSDFMRMAASGGRPLAARDAMEARYKEARDSDKLYNALQAQLAQVDEALAFAEEGRKGRASDKWIDDSSNWAARKGKQLLAFGAGAWRGLAHAVGKVDTWDGGVSDMRNNAALLSAAVRADRMGLENVSDEDRDLLNMAAYNNMVQGENGEYIGHGYTAGEVTGESLPFMIEMVMNPASGTGRAVQKKLMREAVEKYGKEAVRKSAAKYIAAKIGARAAGDVAGSAAMTATSGQFRVAADMIDRMTGDIRYDVDSDGRIVYSGRENGEDALTSYVKAFGAQTIENHSEMLGEYFAPVLGAMGKGADRLARKTKWGKITLDKVGKLISDMGATDTARFITELEKKAKWNGMIGEYAEEVAGNMENALLVGDNTLDTAEGTGVFNLDQNVDTFLGVALMGGFFAGAKTLSYRGPKRQALNEMSAAGKAIDDAVNGDMYWMAKWGGWRNTFLVGTDEEKKTALSEVMGDDSLPMGFRMGVLEFVKAAQKYEGLARAQESKTRNGDGDPVATVNDESYEEGYETADADTMAETRGELDEKRGQLEGLVNDAFFERVDDDPVDALWEVMGNDEFSEDEKQLMLDYVNAKAKLDGMTDRMNDDAAGRMEDAKKRIMGLVNRANGMMTPATMKVDDRPVYIIKGKVQMFPDGSGVDVSNSDQSVIICDAETGEYKFTSPDQIFGVGESIDPQSEIDRANAEIQAELDTVLGVGAGENMPQASRYSVNEDAIASASAEDYGKIRPINESYYAEHPERIVKDLQDDAAATAEYLNGNVDAREYLKMMGCATGEGSWLDTWATEQDIEEEAERMSQQLKAFLRDSSESVQENDGSVQNPDGNGESSRNERAQRPVYEMGQAVTLRTEDGRTVRADVQGVTEDGVEIMTEEPMNGKRVQTVPAETIDALAVSVSDADGNLIWQRDEAAGVVSEEPEAGKPESGPTALERVPVNKETGEPMFEKTDSETALDALNEVTGGNEENTTAIVRAQVDQATKTLEALKKKEPTKKAPSLKGSPMAMVKAQQEAEANYNTAMEEYKAQVAAAEENLNAWSRINSLMNDRKRAIREQQEAERKAREEQLHAEAVARLEEDKRIAAEKAAEQEAVGTHAVNPKIKAKWDGATKVEGNANAITLADGSTIRGHYVLTEAGAATASHDVNNAYEPTEGFPVDENGESVNDRDYKRDKDAQRIVRDMADSYDSRALQTPVIVSKDGVVLSGNNRTMSGEIAAKNGTDKAYVDHLRGFGAMFGFTPEQIDGMQHPRVVFVPDEELPYDASTFARFNAEQQKKQSKPEHAVKLGKIVPDNVFASITNDISRFDRMSDYYADEKAVASSIGQLLDAGVINEMQLPELRTGNALSAAGKELIENTLIGKVFQTSPDAVRQIISTPTLRQSVVMGLNEIANNRTLAKSGYDLSQELAAAVDLVARAKAESPDIYKEGVPVSPYGRQAGLFDDEYGDSRVTDAMVLLLADLLNSERPSDLRKVLSTYNNEAASPATGQMDVFSGEVTSKEELLKNVLNHFRNATPKEQQALIDAAVAERKRRAEAAEPSRGGDETSEQATVVAGSDAEPQQPAVASEEPAKGNEPDADALAKEAEEKLSERITDTEDEWTEPSEYGEIYKHRMFVDGKEVIKVDAPDKSKNYPGTYYEIDGKQFGDLYEVANYIDGNEQPLSAKIEAASAEVNTEPTEAQKEAGNYKKGHVQVGTFDITIEQPQGSVRKGTDADGKQWESKMNNTYGYIRGAVGVDGDHIDVFLSNDIDGWNGRKVYVVDQYNPDGSFDEHKVMLGFNDQDEAKGDYLANYEQGWENGRRIDITGVNLEDFEKWIESSKRKTKPFGEYSSVKKETVGSSFDDFVRDSGGEVIPNGVNRYDVINFAERVLGRYASHTESYGTYNAKRTDVEIPADKLFKSESDWFTAKNGNSIAVYDIQAEACYELVAHKDAQGHLKSVSVIKYYDFDHNEAEPLAKSDATPYSITPSTYTNKKGKTSDVSLLTFDHDLTADQERAVKEFAKERTGEGRFAPARGWKDRESGGWMFRSEEDARKAAEMVGNEQAVADNQPMTAQELRDAVEPKKPTASKKTAAKKPANLVESVPTEEPIEPEKPKYEVSDEEMNGLMNDIRDILGIGDDEGDAGFKFRDPDELTAEQRQKLMSVGQRLAMAMVERGNESFGDYASMMVKALGDKVRPWLKAFYGGLEYVPGYDKYALTPYEEVKAFDVENFDKPNKDVMAQANMIVEEGKAQVAAEKANNELKATRNEQRKETEKQTAANTDAVAAEAESVASEATALAETSSDEQALAGAAERVDETLNKVNEQLALLGYYEADEVEKDYNEAYGYMRNAEKKAVKDAANLANRLIDNLGLDRFEATHSKKTDKKGDRKTKPLATANIAPIGGDITMHLPLEEGRELYVTIGVEPRAAKGVEGFGGSNLEVTHIMFRVDHPEGTGNDRYGRNVFAGSDVTYSGLLKQVQREAYKYLIGSGVTNEGEYAAGDKVQYSTDGGRTWTDAVVVQPNDEGGIRIDTGLAPVMWVNAHPDQLRHKPKETAKPDSKNVPEKQERDNSSIKPIKPEQRVGDLFAGLPDKPSDNGLQGNDEAVRTEAVPADNSGQQQGLRKAKEALAKQLHKKVEDLTEDEEDKALAKIGLCQLDFMD